MKFLIITGMSGAGRTQATKFLEDFGYFCMDNIPSKLLTKFGELYLMSEMQLERLALVMDVRNGNFLDDLYDFMAKMKTYGVEVEILFMDCSDDKLLARYTEKKRLHPLSPLGNNKEGIYNERELLKDLKNQADYVFDTTDMSIWDLKRLLGEKFNGENSQQRMKLCIMSFGYKHGAPNTCDLLFDVRFIPNPYYIPELMHFTGNDENVKEYVLYAEETKMFLEKLKDMLSFLIPLYTVEGKEVLSIGIGCTGGRHRSVAIANELCRILSAKGYTVSLEHRDIGNQ